ncbi:putative disease resistance RPP13-like protein 1 [Iris pallida]|uniref:Disease resistance RPP13-like protein 1 n=1 Tax=Iris pallida TaxID=29817 RepID=A0AAX6GID6_IRIPA|nr:putative disease resistance RPP13-like protein 1 [Iris pallida]
MEKIALSLVGPIVSPIFSKLQNSALPYFGGDITEEELQHLQNTILPKIKAVLLVAAAKNEAVLQPWLVTLKEAAYEAEDVLDMYEYQRLKEAQVSSIPKFIKKLKEKARPFSLKTELKDTMEKLIKIAHGIDQFTSIISNFPNQDLMNQQPPTVSSPTSLVIGRDHERDSIVNMMISAANEPGTSSESRIPVLAIYGIGGAGKTTLAQLINKDPRVEKHFDTKMWVHVSRIFDARAITKKIIESISKDECPHVESFDVLQSILKNMLLLKSKKCLLVLDDVWCLDKERWDQMLIPFNEAGETGSRILITCRAEEVTSKLGVDHSFPLAELEDNDYWSIFMHYSFGDAKKDITDPQLLELAREIMKKLSKSPLAARMVGSSLRGKDVGYWKQTLQRRDMLKDTLGALYWSFELLPPCLQRCFALCSLYPKGYYFMNIKEDFVRLWIAQGFIEVPSNSTVTLEDEAMHYFNELLSKSFFQKKYHWYEMHDLLHDLAENVSKDYCFRIEDDCQRIPANVMHLSVVDNKDISSHLPNIFKLINLRTLIIVSRSIEQDDISGFIQQDDIFGFIQQVFMKFKKLRMLHLGGRYDKLLKLDKSVGGLKLLRYLQVREVEELPESLGKLYHLQFLVIHKSIKNEVPQELNKLINLRYVGGGNEIRASKIPLFGKLTSLQEIGRYEVSTTNKKQFGIGQLKNLQQLRGTLRIDGLENVKDKAETSEALLKEKKHVESLELHWEERWSLERDGSMDEEVLEGLQPHPNLGALKLEGYKGVRLPKWTREDGSLSSSDLYFVNLGRLHSLEIVCCRNLQEIPSLPRMLGRLVIKGCENLSELPLLPLGLKVLDLQGVGFDLERLKVLTSLTHLTLTKLPWLASLLLGPNLTALEDVRIENCENLRSIGNSLVYSSSLKSLYITDCPKLTVQQQQQQADDHWGGGVMERLYVTGCPELNWLWNLNCFTSVRELTVKGCPKLTLIKSGGGDDSLSPMPSSSSSLYAVTIDDLSLLTAALQPRRRECCCLNSLWSLTIEDSTKDEEKAFTAEQEELFQHHLTSLTRLAFIFCLGLPSLPANLENLSSLRVLYVLGCPKIESLPNLPASLETLFIWGGCHPQLKEKYGNDQRINFH